MQVLEDEASNKSEYSVLQAYEHQYREIRNDKTYIVFKQALNTELTVVAFPRKDKLHGYVVILAKAKGSPAVKVMPETDFLVTQDAYAAVRADASLSKEVDQFIAARVQKY